MVDVLSEGDFRVMARGNVVFSSFESLFLEQFIPYSFLGLSVGDALKIEAGIIEITQKVFQNLAVMDGAVHRASRLSELAKEKALVFNPILGVLGLETIAVQDHDIVASLFEIKSKGLEILVKLTESVDFTKSNRKPIDKFPDVCQQLHKIFGRVPVIIYGSVLTSDTPQDIDTRVFPEEIDINVYRSIVGSYNKDSKLPISFVIVPHNYHRSFSLSDGSSMDTPENSILIYGDIPFYRMTNERLQMLKKAYIARGLMILREALTHKGIAESENIPQRMKARIKIVKFIKRDLEILTNAGIQEPPNLQFTDKDSYINALVRANQYVHNIITKYLS